MESSKKETIKGLGIALGSIVVAGGLVTGLGMFVEHVNKQRMEGVRQDSVAESQRLEALMRRNIIATVKESSFRASGNYLGPGIGFNLENGYGPGMWTLNETNPTLSFTAETIGESPEVLKIIVDTHGKSDEVLSQLAVGLKTGSVVNISKGVESEKGVLFVNLEDISIQ